MLISGKVLDKASNADIHLICKLIREIHSPSCTAEERLEKEATLKRLISLIEAGL